MTNEKKREAWLEKLDRLAAELADMNDVAGAWALRGFADAMVSGHADPDPARRGCYGAGYDAGVQVAVELESFSP